MREILKTIIDKYSKNPNYIFSDELNLIDDLNLDSLALISIVTEIEETFNIVFDAEDLDWSMFTNINNIEQLIVNKTNK
ncbi:acyl carrier protein [Inconstantimicrobium mannanitabidum]|uniref:Uncharacterized protein n=1 Tax=Inconstantimicrobium mannanitabidum TaxID=1604901 RepID=A0ACB5RH08_9CLOT|nr:acyl carrier protein [Clostridium sp. TW13]GKX68380.1 hypothetical protein rsdtw13_36380 [Clostridium sp. TW13]